MNCEGVALITKVSAIGGQYVFNRDTDIVDHAYVMMEFENGIRACLQLCMFVPPLIGPDLEFDALGEQGRLTKAGDKVMVLRRPPIHNTAEYRVGEDKVKTVGGGHAGDIPQMYRFLDCVSRQTPAPINAEVGLDSVAVCLAAEDSIRRNGTWIDVASFIEENK